MVDTLWTLGQILHVVLDTPEKDQVQEHVRPQETGMDRLQHARKANDSVLLHWPYKLINCSI